MSRRESKDEDDWAGRAITAIMTTLMLLSLLWTAALTKKVRDDSERLAAVEESLRRCEERAVAMEAVLAEQRRMHAEIIRELRRIRGVAPPPDASVRPPSRGPVPGPVDFRATWWGLRW